MRCWWNTWTTREVFFVPAPCIVALCWLSSPVSNSITDLRKEEVMIGHEEVWRHVAHECPRRIISTLHSHGLYIHGTCSRFPGKILCIHQGGDLPADWAPTPAQVEAWESEQISVQEKACS